MCGIAGIYDPAFRLGFNRDKWKDCLHKMALAMAHRGPDDEGMWFDVEKGMGLAHRRLSILDLSPEGHQPMISSSGRFVLIYNGEIYNFREIAAELKKERDISFRGGSDTEVLLQAIEQWGVEKAVKKTVGMFAFAVWDRKHRTLILCRDRLGIKPLYYGVLNGVLFFSSELKPILAIESIRPVLDLGSLSLYFRYNTIPAPHSIFKGIRKLLPGTFLVVSQDSDTSGLLMPPPVAFWSPDNILRKDPERIFSLTEVDALEELKKYLKDAISYRMISDVPVGAFLSGGVDSSLVVSLMQEMSEKKVRTFSIGFEEIGYNEAIYAKQVASYIGTHHTELYITARDALDVVPDLPEIFDEPFSDSSQIPTYILSRLTKEHVTVSLSGDGGDELFGGYNRHFLLRKIERPMKNIPFLLRKIISAVIQKISPLTWDRIGYKVISHLPLSHQVDMPGDRIHKFAEIFKQKDSQEIYTTLVSHFKEPAQIVLGTTEPLIPLLKLKEMIKGQDISQQMMIMDLFSYLPDDILTKVDRASMAVGLEARVPLLDHRLVEFAFRLPVALKIRGSRGKWILRKVLDDYLPSSLIDRPKTGFAVPVDAWLRGALKEWALDLMRPEKLLKDGILNADLVSAMWREHQSGKKNWQYHLWDVLMFQAWKEYYRL